MRKTGKFFEHVASVIGGARLAKNVAFEGDLGVGTNDDGWANGAGSDEFGFGDSETLDESVGGFAGVGSFVDGGRERGEGETSIVKDFGAADGGGSKDEFHGESWISGAEEYYRASAVTACALVQGKRRAMGTIEADGKAAASHRTQNQMITDSWYSPNTRRRASEISPMVA
jgi:hypothetical protein